MPDVVQQLTFGVFRDMAVLLNFLRLRPSVVRKLLFGFCCGKGRSTEADYTHAMEKLETPEIFEAISYAYAVFTAQCWAPTWADIVEKASAIGGPEPIHAWPFEELIHASCSTDACVFHGHHACCCRQVRNNKLVVALVPPKAPITPRPPQLAGMDAKASGLSP